jgi:hypothetical protein
MNQNLCEIGFVLDRSGSMTAMEKEAIGGFNAFLESQQKLPGEARPALVLFDHEYIVAQHGHPIKGVPKLDEHSYVPRGTTALLEPSAGRSTQSANDSTRPRRRSGLARS